MSPAIPTRRIGMVVLLLNPVVNWLLEWLNERISKEDRAVAVGYRYEFYRFSAVSQFFQSLGIGQGWNISLFGNLG